MKKTLITLMALAGCAMGATVSDAFFGISNFDGLTSQFDINNTNAELTITNSATKEGYYEIAGTTFSTNTYKDNGQAKRAYFTITFVLDLAKLNTPDSNTPLFLDNVKWGSVLTSDRTLKGAWDNIVWTGSANYTTDTLGTSDTVVLTFNTGWTGYKADGTTADEATGGQCPSEVYINGVLAEQAYGLAHGSKIENIYINETFASAISAVYVHNTMVHGADAVALYNSIVAPSIPEPATATLSLLALAGLAARRRRK